jgi:hypothetical protein
MLRQLKTCQSAGIRRVYISIDGPKNESEKQLQFSGVQEIQDFALASGMKVSLRLKNSNAGLAIAVLDGISWFFDEVEFGIILEDDLIVSQSFFDFVAESQDRFSARRQINMISGNNYEINENKGVSATNYPLIWGWATWADEWRNFLSSLRTKIKINWTAHLSTEGYWVTAALQSRSGLVDSWAMSFAHYFKSRKLICLLPPTNLVSNGGVGARATHSRTSDQYINFPIQELAQSFSWDIPSAYIIRKQNIFLEKFIYKISARHILSPIKFAFHKFPDPKSPVIIERLEKLQIQNSYQSFEWGE